MAIITNKDIKIMVEVEELLHNKLVKNNGIKDIDKNGEEYYYFDENDKEYNIWVQYWNLVEKFIQHKKYANKKSNEYNKKNKDYHRIMNNICACRKSGNVERLEYWKNEMKKLKESE